MGTKRRSLSMMARMGCPKTISLHPQRVKVCLGGQETYPVEISSDHQRKNASGGDQSLSSGRCPDSPERSYDPIYEACTPFASCIRIIWWSSRSIFESFLGQGRPDRGVSRMRSQSGILIAIGFSRKTCFPASKHAVACSTCKKSGLQTKTMSISEEPATSLKSFLKWSSFPHFLWKLSSCSWEWPHKVVTRTPRSGWWARRPSFPRPWGTRIALYEFS